MIEGSIDLSKKHKELFKMAKAPSLVEVPDLHFLMMDGEGDPNDSERFRSSVETLYGIAYGIKFARKKKGTGPDFKVMPLEGIWWAKEGEVMALGKKDGWLWTLMIMVPERIGDEELDEAKEALARKRPNLHSNSLRMSRFQEGLCAQVLHIGPYAGEAPTIELLHDFVKAQGYEPHGKHHEIYMSDPRRTKPEYWKTIIRHPVRQLCD